MSTIDIPNAAPADYSAPPTPDPARFGLFSVANVIEDPSLRYEAGIEWEPMACDVAGVLSMVCPPDGEDTREGFPLTARDGEGLVQVAPFAVLGSYLCSTFSRPLDEAENRARQHLALGEERAVEYAIATGIADNTPSFVGAVDLTPAGGAVSVGQALALLEGHLGANYGGVGAIHAPRVASPLAADQGGVSRYGQRMETPLGTMVAFGGGYDIASGGGSTVVLYATSRPIIRRSEVIVTPDQDHRPQITNNDVEIFAQRIYSVGWECVTAMVTAEIYPEA